MRYLQTHQIAKLKKCEFMKTLDFHLQQDLMYWVMIGKFGIFRTQGIGHGMHIILKKRGAMLRKITRFQ